MAHELTEEEREFLRELREKLGHHLDDKDLIQDVLFILKLVRWMRWTRVGVGALVWWVTPAILAWTLFEDSVRILVSKWLGGGR